MTQNIPTKASNITKQAKPLTEAEMMSALTFDLTYEEWNSSSDYLQFQRNMGGFNPDTKELSPLRFSSDYGLEHYLSSLAGTFESGMMSQTSWPTQLFADETALGAFLDALEAWDGRLTDRHYRVVRLITSRTQSCATNADAADALRSAADWLLNDYAAQD